MLENRVFREFQKYNSKRLLVEGALRKNSEVFFFSSCGDEFFRDQKNLSIKVNGLFNRTEEFYVDGDTLRVVNLMDFNTDVVELLQGEVSEKENITCIIFKACNLEEVPFLFSRIEYLEIYTANLDFHSMIYDGRFESKEVNYLWLFCTWVKL